MRHRSSYTLSPETIAYLAAIGDATGANRSRTIDRAVREMANRIEAHLHPEAREAYHRRLAAERGAAGPSVASTTPAAQAAEAPAA